MSENGNFGFGKLVPGFDFLQSLAKGASQTIPQMPSLSNWVAPTINVEELEKRIGELKAVHFWLDQNGKALGATIQALEVQKMTLATLKGMNFNMAEVASALKLKTADMMTGGMEKAAGAAGAAAATVSGAARAAVSQGGQDGDKANGAATGATATGTAPVDPLAWWGALTQQFQEIAANAMKDATQKTAMDAARNLATGAAQEAMKAATSMAKGAMAKGALAMGKQVTAAAAPAKAKAARKTASRKTAAKTKTKAKGR